jgi:hypothetical protein
MLLSKLRFIYMYICDILTVHNGGGVLWKDDRRDWEFK